MDDYKELVEELSGMVKNTRGYDLPVVFFFALAKAAEAIEQLVTDIDAVRKERDAMLDDLSKLRYCSTCKLCTDTDDDDYYWCSVYCDWNEYNDTCEDWEWRGVQE